MPKRSEERVHGKEENRLTHMCGQIVSLSVLAEAHPCVGKFISLGKNRLK